jgi:hypothetical protein
MIDNRHVKVLRFALSSAIPQEFPLFPVRNLYASSRCGPPKAKFMSTLPTLIHYRKNIRTLF